MEKYKICPSCREKNEPTLLECIYCEADLTGVKITDEESERMQENNSIAEQQTAELVRLCECGAKNPPNARKCSLCGEDISDITPTPDTAEKPAETTFVLSSTDGQYAYKLTSDGIIIGRENVMSEYLSVKSYVSRSHARLLIINGELFIENMSNTNFTYVNNQKITGKTQLKDGDEIGLGGTSVNGKSQSMAAYFLVRIGQCM